MKYTAFTLIIATLASFAQSIPLSENSPKAPHDFRSELWEKRGKCNTIRELCFMLLVVCCSIIKLLMYGINLKSSEARDMDLTEVFKNVKRNIEAENIKRDADGTESENVKRDVDETESENVKLDVDETEPENVKRDVDETEPENVKRDI
jgi:hypothetical protein